MELDKVAFGEGMIDAEQGAATNLDESRVCLNCGTSLTGPYCSSCGQKAIPKRQTLGELITNFIGSFYSFESKFFQTLRYLLFKPGFLPLEYTQGKRERYYHPARAYVFISFIFFLIFFSFPDPEEKEVVNFNSDGKELSKAQRDSLMDETNWNFAMDSTTTQYQTVAQYDSAQNTLSEAKRDGWFKKRIRQKELALKSRYKGRSGEFSKDFQKSFLENFSKVFFFLLPIFALVLKLLYVRRDFYYSEHLVFSIYYYNFAYLAGSLYLLADQVDALDWVSSLIMLWIFVYLFWGMKKMYKQGWGKTLAKYTLFVLLFSVCMGLGMLINVVATFWSLSNNV